MAEGGKYLNMKYWELLKEENEAVAERHELAMERIGHMKEEATVGEPYRAFFERTVQFIELRIILICKLTLLDSCTETTSYVGVTRVCSIAVDVGSHTALTD
mgnify:CR=1 FL=1